MKSYNVLRILKSPLFAMLFVAVLAGLGLVVMSLWNWLMPALFGLKLIGYWQALGLIILSKTLFGGFRGSGGRGGRRLHGMRGTLETADAGGTGKIPSRVWCLLEPRVIAGSEADCLTTDELASSRTRIVRD
jgi:hypothetical protein